MAQALSVFVNIGAKLLPSLNTSASSIERRFGMMNKRLRIQAAETKLAFREMTGALTPLAAMAAAGGLTMGLKGIFGEGMQYKHHLADMRAAGRSATEMARLIAAANKTMEEVPTSTINRNLDMLKETTLAFGGIGHAMDNLSFNMKIDSLLKNQFGDDAGGGHLFNKLIRSIELRGGKVSNEVYKKIASGMYKAMSVSGGTITPDEYLGFTQQSSPFMRSYSDDFYTKFAPSIIQEMGGERAGTALSAFGMQVMGKVPLGGKALVEDWKKFGLLKPGTGTGADASRKGWQLKDVVGGDLALTNPYEWFGNVMIPKLRAAGFDMNDPKKVLEASTRLFGRATGQRLASTFLDPAQRGRIDADRKLFDKAMGPDQAYTLKMREDPKMALAATASSLKKLELSLGKTLFNPSTQAAILTVANAVNYLAGAFDAHPNFAKGMVGLMGLGAVAATIKVLGVSLRWAFSPLKWLLFSGGPRNIGLVGWLLRGMKIGGGAIARSIGPILMRGLVAVGPWLLRGVAAAFGYLSNPVGWAILAASAALLVWNYRKQIAGAWHALTGWFANTAWPAIKSTVMSVNWAAVGSSIVDGMTFGFASKLPSMLSTVHRFLKSEVGFNMKDGLTLTPPPAVAGARANGGPISSGRAWLVGEQGPELVVPHRSGTVIPAAATAAMLAKAPRGGGNTWQVTVNVNGARDPAEVGREVERALERLSRRQEAFLTD